MKSKDDLMFTREEIMFLQGLVTENMSNINKPYLEEIVFPIIKKLNSQLIAISEKGEDIQIMYGPSLGFKITK